MVAKAQACANGANAHDVHALLGKYLILCELAERDPEFVPRHAAMEQSLRAFCQTGTLQTARVLVS